jgi:collagenase-like PrtC family protease
MSVRKVELMAPAGNWDSLQAAISTKAEFCIFWN